MQLLINFQGQDKAELSGTSSFRIGLDLVDYIRTKSNCPDLPLEIIREWVCPISLSNIPVIVEEPYGRQTGYFKNTDRIGVLVSLSGLRKFFNLMPIVQKNSLNGEILAASLEWVLDEKELLAEWKKAGFPLEWNPYVD